MTTQDFSNQWDVLWNNVTSNQAPGLNEYEKSVFLTKAQNQLVTEYFNNRVDQVGGGFDGSQKRQYDFSSLIKTAELGQVSNADIGKLNKIDKRSLCYSFPLDYFLSVNEMLSDSKYQYNVMPLSYDEYARLMLKPYAYPVKKGAWRLLTGKLPYKVASDEYGNTIKTVSGTVTGLSIGYAKITDTSDSTKWYGNAPFTTVANIAWSDVPLIDNPAKVEGGIGIVCKVSNGIYTRLYLEVCKNGTTYQVRLFSIGASAVTPTDSIAMKFVQSMIKGYVDNNPEEDTIYHEFHKVFGDFDGSSFKPERHFMLNVADISSYTESYSLAFNGELFTFSESEQSSPVAEIIGKFADSLIYTLRYIKKPAPIVLVDLEDAGYTELTIEGVSTVSECELPEETHQEILERAVTLAKIAWAGGTATQAQSQRSRE